MRLDEAERCVRVGEQRLGGLVTVSRRGFFCVIFCHVATGFGGKGSEGKEMGYGA